MRLAGIDVGFSIFRRSSGVARLDDSGEVRVGHTTSHWEQQRLVLGTGRFDVAAIDAPYTDAETTHYRACERALSRGAFHRRCKPGCTHVRGTGMRLRAAGWQAAEQLRPQAPEAPLDAPFPRVAGYNVVEAFPNAFLGVGLEESSFSPHTKRGEKFDSLYDEWLRHGLFRSLGARVRVPDPLLEACERNHQHDERAALVCLLTGACVYRGRYTAIGDDTGGYLFLPPWDTWAAWARHELDCQRATLRSLEIWIDGRVYRAGEPVPLA